MRDPFVAFDLKALQESMHSNDVLLKNLPGGQTSKQKSPNRNEGQAVTRFVEILESFVKVFM
jgi:hypothetical protein